MLKGEQGALWRRPFIAFYLGQRRTCDLGESCALASLSSEVMRADDETREADEQVLAAIFEEISSGLRDLPGNDHDDRAIALMSLLAGGVTLARAVHDPAMSERIANAVARYATALTEQATGDGRED